MPPRRAALRTTTPLRARSAKTAARDRRYARDRRVYLVDNPWCVARLDGCTGRATEVHHAAGRSPSVFFDQSLWRALCHHDHGVLTRKPALAYRLGLSVRRNEKRQHG